MRHGFRLIDLRDDWSRTHGFDGALHGGYAAACRCGWSDMNHEGRLFPRASQREARIHYKIHVALCDAMEAQVKEKYEPTEDDWASIDEAAREALREDEATL